MVVGAVGFGLARATAEASPVYAFAPVIPLVPGKFMFQALVLVTEWITLPADHVDTQELIAEAITSSTTAAATIVALAVGATAPFLLLPRARKPV